MQEELNDASSSIREEEGVKAELDAFVWVLIEDDCRLFAQLLRLLLCIAFHDFCYQVLISSFCSVPRVAKDAQLGDLWPILRVVALSLAHRRHLPDQFARFRMPITIDGQLLLITTANGLGSNNLKTTFMVFGPILLL